MSEHDNTMNEHEADIPEHDTPSLAGQRAATEVLTAIDEVIADTEALCAKLATIGRGLAHDLRSRGLDAKGKLRDPIPAGRMPKGWTAPFSSPAPEIDDRFRACFGDAPLPVPPVAEQLKMVEILAQHTDALHAEEALLAKLRTLRAGIADPKR